MYNGQRIDQSMIFSPDHPAYPNVLKGLRHVFAEQGISIKGILDKCKTKCDPKATICCCQHIMEQQPDFQQQQSLLQEVIQKAGHLCILLPKFHCELNFIEFFWGAVKRYLQEHCDMTFETLKGNMLQALSSVELATIQRWEHRMHRWMGAYHEGLGTRDANAKVKAFSSTKYKSHRQIPETLASTFDQ